MFKTPLLSVLLPMMIGEILVSTPYSTALAGDAAAASFDNGTGNRPNGVEVNATFSFNSFWCKAWCPTWNILPRGNYYALESCRCNEDGDAV